MSIDKNIIDQPNIARLLAAVEPMERAAYVRGWKDAVAAVTRAADTLLEPPPLPVEIAKAKASGATPAVDSNLAKVWAVVKANPGMTGAATTKAVRQHGYDIAAESVRTCLHRLKKRNLIEQRSGKWFPAESAEQPATAE